jgi:putative endonuclease
MWVYIMASQKNGTLYIGVTNSLSRRVTEHREGRGSASDEAIDVQRLVYAEAFQRADEAIDQETRIKGWRRASKIALIEKGNPNWDDLYGTVHLD